MRNVQRVSSLARQLGPLLNGARPAVRESLHASCVGTKCFRPRNVYIQCNYLSYLRPNHASVTRDGFRSLSSSRLGISVANYPAVCASSSRLPSVLHRSMLASSSNRSQDPTVPRFDSRRQREYRSVVRPRVVTGISKWRSRVNQGQSHRRFSSNTPAPVKKPESRIAFRDALRSPVKAAKFTVQSLRDLMNWGRHMWAGIKLLAADVRVSWRVLAKISHGKQITRRERNFLVQTGVDLARLVPFSLFLIVPAAEFALPFALRLFPNMLPSQFQSEMQKEESMKRQLKANLELAKYLRDVVEKQAKSIKSSDKDSAIKQEAGQLTDFLQAIRSGKQVDLSEVSRFARLFNDELTLDGAVRAQLVAMAKYMGIAAHGTDQLLRFRLRSRLNSIKNDDMQITWEGGADSLTDEEVVKACADRGIRSVGVSNQDLRVQLSSWLEMSQDRAVPGSLMIMSRAFLYAGDEDGLKETLSSLSEEVYEDVTMEAGAGDGSTIDRLEEARRQSKLIELESEREARKDKEAAELKQRIEEEKVAAQMSAPLEDPKVSIEEIPAVENISDANGMASATAREAKIISERFEAGSTESPAPVPPAASSSDDFVSVKNGASGAGDAVSEGDRTSIGAGKDVLESPGDLTKDEEQLAVERNAMRRFVDHLQSFSSESAVEKERLELENLKDELEEAESLLQSRGGGNESELNRFKRMVSKLEKQVENVDAKLGASMKLLDLDNDGRMQFDEIVDAVKLLAPSEGDAEVVTEALRRLDADADGTITREDIGRLLRELEVESAGMEVSETNGVEISTDATSSNGSVAPAAVKSASVKA